MTKSVGMAIAKGRCPQCRKGGMFSVNLLSYRKLTEVNKTCLVCGANFHPEPDFYYGAMFISYAFSVILVVASLVVINTLVTEPRLWMYIATVLAMNIVLFPAMLRYSKVLYLYAVGGLKYQG